MMMLLAATMFVCAASAEIDTPARRPAIFVEPLQGAPPSLFGQPVRLAWPEKKVYFAGEGLLADTTRCSDGTAHGHIAIIRKDAVIDLGEYTVDPSAASEELDYAAPVAFYEPFSEPGQKFSVNLVSDLASGKILGLQILWEHDKTASVYLEACPLGAI